MPWMELREEPWCPEPRDPAPIAYCEVCGGELYYESEIYETEHRSCVCYDCFRRWVREEVEDT